MRKLRENMRHADYHRANKSTTRAFISLTDKVIIHYIKITTYILYFDNLFKLLHTYYN